MKVLLIHQYYLEKNEGGGSRWNEMTKIWANAGNEITVLSGMVHYNTGKKSPMYKGKYFSDQKEFEKGIRVIRSHVSEAYNINFIGRLWGYFSFVFSSLWAGIYYAREKYDVIIVTSPPLFVGITAYMLSLFKKIPFVFEIRDLWPESAIDTGVITNRSIIKLAYLFEGFIYRKAKKINVLTPAFRSYLIEKKRVPANKIIFIPNAADFSLVESIAPDFDKVDFRNMHKIGLDKFVITYVGAHGVANHLIQVIETAELLKNTNVLFLLIGEGMQKQMLKQIAQQKGLDNIRFLDAVSKVEVFKYILASDMGASILKKVETFKTVYSNKTFDYMSCKKPLFMLIDGVSRELVEEAKCGIYVEPENSIEFKDKILEYVINNDRVKKEGENGFMFAKINFDRSVLASKYLTEISEIK
ncbi:MAG: glycosyltransferase family 4 protein [Silvanigrellaceae bacterium]|nr:glycosyltransferase family 4 protein [Silvanigrellaceae bacterium]